MVQYMFHVNDKEKTLVCIFKGQCQKKVYVNSRIMEDTIGSFMVFSFFIVQIKATTF